MRKLEIGNRLVCRDLRLVFNRLLDTGVTGDTIGEV